MDEFDMSGFMDSAGPFESMDQFESVFGGSSFGSDGLFGGTLAEGKGEEEEAGGEPVAEVGAEGESGLTGVRLESQAAEFARGGGATGHGNFLAEEEIELAVRNAEPKAMNALVEPSPQVPKRKRSNMSSPQTPMRNLGSAFHQAQYPRSSDSDRAQGSTEEFPTSVVSDVTIEATMERKTAQQASPPADKSRRTLVTMVVNKDLSPARVAEELCKPVHYPSANEIRSTLALFRDSTVSQELERRSPHMLFGIGGGSRCYSRMQMLELKPAQRNERIW